MPLEIVIYGSHSPNTKMALKIVIYGSHSQKIPMNVNSLYEAVILVETFYEVVER